MQHKKASQYLTDSVITVVQTSTRHGLRSVDTAIFVKPRTTQNSLPSHLTQ